MNTAKINYVWVGIFITAAFVGSIVSMALLSGQTGSTDPYHSVYDNVTGVKFGTQVLYEGYPIGQVEEVTPVAMDGAMRFKVDYEITEGWQIPDDSVARIGSSGLLSAITINIEAGASPMALKPGQEINGREQADLFAVMGEMAGEVTNIAENDIRPLLKTINATADAFAQTVETVGVLVENDGAHMVRTFSGVADDLSELTEDLNERLPRISENVDSSTQNFAKLSADLTQTRAKLDTVLDEMNSLITTSNGMVGENRQEIRKSITDLKHVTDSLARHIDAVNQNVEGTARNMYEFSREIRQNPGLLLSGTSSPQDQPDQ